MTDRAVPPPPRTRRLTVIAQDPSVRRGSRIVMAEVAVPREDLKAGPWGHRVQVVDYDASLDRFREPKRPASKEDPYAGKDPDRLILDPEFHAWNCYAIVMSTLQRFEFALGRRVGWSFGGHQIKVVPHAFADANAFYSRQDESILFGYFQGERDTVFTCLSHDVISHETSHAILDGLRQRYMDPSAPDQAAFHEGFADVVALLSVFALPGVVERIVDLGLDGDAEGPEPPRRIAISRLTKERLFRGLLALGEQMGSEIQGVRGRALRTSGEIKPSPKWYREDPRFEESHRRGEILVAAVLHAFVAAWEHRLEGMGAEAPSETKTLDRQRVVEEGAALAGVLLTTAIRALDYAPTVDLEFGDYLSAILTGDREVRPDDTKYDLRRRLRQSFASYGIRPGDGAAPGGAWPHAPQDLSYAGVHLASLQRDPDEVFRFLWDNRDASRLALDENAYTEVLSVRPCTRIDPDDGFTLPETVAEYVQIRRLRGSELGQVGMKAPKGMSADTEVTLYGGGALIFDEFGHLKYHVAKSIGGEERSIELARQWASGAFRADRRRVRRFAALHLRRAAGGSARREEW